MCRLYSNLHKRLLLPSCPMKYNPNPLDRHIRVHVVSGYACTHCSQALLLVPHGENAAVELFSLPSMKHEKKLFLSPGKRIYMRDNISCKKTITNFPSPPPFAIHHPLPFLILVFRISNLIKSILPPFLPPFPLVLFRHLRSHKLK